MQNSYSPIICIAGKNNIAVEGLRLVLSQYDKKRILFLPNPLDNGRDDWQESLKKYGKQLGVLETTIENLYNIEDLLFISLEYSELIDINKFKSSRLFNIHFSLLPKYKGMHTSVLPILYGELSSGVTLHKIDNGIDTGNIIDQIEFRLSPSHTSRDLYYLYLSNAFELLQNNLTKLISNAFETYPQSISNSSYFSKKSVDYKNIKINFNKTAFQVSSQLRAYIFEEYQLPTFKGIEIYKTEIINNRSFLPPGEIIIENKFFFEVSTIDYDIKIYKKIS